MNTVDKKTYDHAITIHSVSDPNVIGSIPSKSLGIRNQIMEKLRKYLEETGVGEVDGGGVMGGGGAAVFDIFAYISAPPTQKQIDDIVAMIKQEGLLKYVDTICTSTPDDEEETVLYKAHRKVLHDTLGRLLLPSSGKKGIWTSPFFDTVMDIVDRYENKNNLYDEEESNEGALFIEYVLPCATHAEYFERGKKDNGSICADLYIYGWSEKNEEKTLLLVIQKFTAEEHPEGIFWNFSLQSPEEYVDIDVVNEK